jgi:hypothetical protein
MMPKSWLAADISARNILFPATRLKRHYKKTFDLRKLSRRRPVVTRLAHFSLFY